MINMLIAKTLGGLPPGVYIRHFLFSLMFPAFFLWVNHKGGHPPPHEDIAFFILSVLYPYARHAYETVLSYIVGNTMLMIPMWIFLPCKIFTMGICWGAAVMIAPVGLIILYLQNSKHDNSEYFNKFN